MCGFIRSNGVDVAESAVRDWLPGPGPDSSLVFEWTPIHGCFGKNNLINFFFSDIHKKRTTLVDFLQASPENPVGRQGDHVHSRLGIQILAGDSGSASSASTSEQSI